MKELIERIRTGGLNDQLMRDFSRRLDCMVRESAEGVHILKYGLLPEYLWKVLFDYTGRDPGNGVVYMPVDEGMLSAYFAGSGDQEGFYRRVLGNVAGLEGKLSIDMDRLKSLKRLFQDDFSRLYDNVPLKGEALMSNWYLFGVNLHALMAYLSKDSLLFPFVDIRAGPVLPEGSESYMDASEDGRVVKMMDKEMGAVANRALELAEDLYRGSEDYKKIVATPGWMVDALRSSSARQRELYEFAPGIFFGDQFSKKTVFRI